MNAVLTQQQLFSNKAAVGLALVIASLIGVAVANIYGLIFVAGLGSMICAGMFFVRYPVAWLNVLFASLYFWITDSSKELTVLEVVAVGAYLGGLAVWFVWTLLFRRKKLVHNTGDRLILLAYAGSVFSLAVSMANGTPVLTWVREWLLFSFVLYYFPIREYINTEKRLKTMLFLLSAVAFGAGIRSLYQYYLGMNNAVYLFHLVAARATRVELVYASASIVFLYRAVTHDQRMWRVFHAGLSMFFLGTLIASFSRSFWVAWIVGVAAIFFLTRGKQRWRVPLYFTVASVLGIFALAQMFPKKLDALSTVIEYRVTTIFAPTKSKSLSSRGMESKVAIEEILEHPMYGRGFGTELKFWDPINLFTTSVTYLHNSHLFILHKLGIPLYLCLVAGFSWIVYSGLRIAWQGRFPTHWNWLYYSVFIVLAMQLFVSVFGNQFGHRDSIFILAVFLALTQIVPALQIPMRELAPANPTGPAQIGPN